MQVSDIKTAVLRTAADADQLQITDADIIRWVNEAMRDIAVENQLLQKIATTSSVIGQVAYAQPSDILKFHSIRYDDQRLTFLSMDEAESRYSLGDGTKGVPEVVYSWAGNYEFYPAPEAVKTIKVYYTRLPTEVTAVGNTPELPVGYHQRIVDYCLAQVALQDDNINMYSVKMQEFREGSSVLKDIPEWENNSYPMISVGDADEWYV